MYLKEQKDLCVDTQGTVGNVIIHPTAQIDPSAVIGPNVIVGAGCKIGKGVRIQDSALFEAAEIKGHTFIRNSIIGWKSIVGSWVRIEGVSVLAEDVVVHNEVFIN
jgi:mannose-1-phosphate guanylyltransferase